MNDVTVILEAVKSLSTGAVPFLVLLWWIERNDRKAAEKELQEGYKELLVQSLETQHRSSSAIDSSNSTVTELKNGLVTSTASMTSLIRSMKRQ